MVRPEDEYPYDRNQRALIWRVGTIVSATATRLVVDVAGGQLTNVMMLKAVDVTTAGTKVMVVSDRGKAVAIGIVK